MQDNWELLEPLYDHFDGMARSITGPNVSKAAAEDIVQDSLMALKQRLDSGAKIESPRGYLERSIQNRVGQYVLAQALETPRGGLSMGQELDLYQPDPYQQAEQRVDLLHAMDALTADQRAVYALVQLRGLSEYETGRILGISQSTVSRRYEAARQAMAEDLL